MLLYKLCWGGGEGGWCEYWSPLQWRFFSPLFWCCLVIVPPPRLKFKSAFSPTFLHKEENLFYNQLDEISFTFTTLCLTGFFFWPCNQLTKIGNAKILYDISFVTFFSFKMEKTNCKSVVSTTFSQYYLNIFSKEVQVIFFLFSVMCLVLLFGIPGFQVRISVHHPHDGKSPELWNEDFWYGP